MTLLSMKDFKALLLALALSGACARELPDTAAPALMSFRAFPEAATRTSLGEGWSVLWSASDAVSLFEDTESAGTTFTVSSTQDGGTVATFSGLTPQSAGGYLFALYPASASARLTDASGTVSAEIPTFQAGAEGSFDPRAAIALAKVGTGGAADGDILHFKNAGALLFFTVPGNYITRVKIESRDGSIAMTGPASISYNGGAPAAVPCDGAKSYVEVSVPEKSMGKRYCAVVYPGSYSAGFRVSFYTSVNYYNRYTSSMPLELPRNGNVLLIDKNWGQNDDRATATESGHETPEAREVELSIRSAVSNYYNFTVNYTLEGLGSAAAEHGLIYSFTESEPTCGSVGQEGKLPGPLIPSTPTASLTQCIPNSILQPGRECHLRAYCYDSTSGAYAYSPVFTLTLPAQPEGSSIVSSGLDSPAEGISLFSFTADGSYSGFCAKASCGSGSGVRLGVNNAPMGKASAVSMASQLQSSGALVLVNGQIFGSQGNIGLAWTGGELRYNNYSSDGIENCRCYGNSYSGWQPVTRAILGTGSDGTPGAFWCSLIGGKAYFFDRPIPAGTAGSSAYAQVTASSGPGPALEWAPQEALSTGPMLLYGGKVCVSEDKIETGVYWTNYELWDTSSGGIYGSSRQRTAIGYDSDSGEVYLVAVTSSVTLTRLALIMKGLGCDFAMNLDGGGSTQMEVAITGPLTSNSRAVKSTVGFFAR